MPYLTLRDGTSLYHLDSAGTGRPMVFLANATVNSQMWELQLPYLTDRGLRCVAYDRRGHGRSDWPAHGYDYDHLADDLDELIRHLDLRDVILVGGAMGCGEIVRYLSRHGSARVGGVVMIATVTPILLRGPDNPDGLDRAVLDEMVTGLLQDRPHFAAQIAPAFFGPAIAPPAAAVGNGAGSADGAGTVSAEFVRWFCDLSLQCSPTVSRAVYELLFTADLRADLAAVDVPALIVHGDQDPFAPLALCGERTARAIPGSELVVVPGASHGLALTAPRRLNDLLLRFATTLARPVAG